LLEYAVLTVKPARRVFDSVSEVKAVE